MKIFITGTAGFIGFNLAKSLLENNHNVYGYDGITNYYDINLKNSRNKILKKYKKFSFTKGMLENKNLLNKSIVKFKPEIIIHLAAQAGVRYSIDKPRTYLSSNIMGTYNIIELAHKVKVKHLMIASSSSVYGANKKTPYSENDSVKLQMSIYASTKLATESIAHSYSNIWKTPTTVLRFFTVYGPWGRPDMALFKFTKSILEGKKIDIYNKGNLYRDFTYIDDIVDGISLLIKKIPKFKKKSSLNKIDSLSSVAPFRIINIGNSKKIKLLDFIKAIENSLDKKALRNYMSMQKGDVFMTLANTKLLKKITGFKPKINYKEGVRKFVEWYLDYYKKYNL
jgi:UDP-glucuronate 4-epimerase